MAIISILTFIAFSTFIACSTYSYHAYTNLVSKQFRPKHIHTPIELEQFDYGLALNTLAEAVRIKTVSYEPGVVSNADGFRQLYQLFQSKFPLVHQHTHIEQINNYSLLYTWKGSNTDLKPTIIMSHLDVVPAEGDLGSKWSNEPFAGFIHDGFLYGRGTIDTKISVLGALEAVEALLRHKYQPTRTLLLAFGHDEEVMGQGGAASIVQLLKQRYGTVEFVLDEGGIISEDLIPGFSNPVAMIAVGEKGFSSYTLSVESTGGHSSMPLPGPDKNAVSILARALVKLDENPLPIDDRFARMMLEYLAPELPDGILKFAVANWNVLSPVILKELGKKASGNANLRSIMIPTMLSGSLKSNVLPTLVTATVNTRLLPGETTESMLEYIRNTIADDRIQIKIHDDCNNPPPVSPHTTSQFKLLQYTIEQIVPSTPVVPFVTVATTDARYYSELTPNVFRFVPVKLKPEDLARIHGINERIHISDYERTIKFMLQLIKNANELDYSVVSNL